MTTFATAHALHIGGREEQQDSAAVLQSGDEALLVLADGMGGHAGGQLASAAVVATAERLWQDGADRSDPGAFLTRIFEEAHAEINRIGEERGINPRSTGVLVHLRDNKATWTHIGDSRLYRFRGTDVLGRTHDHSVVQMLRDMGKISEEEMGHHPDQNRLTHSLGGETDPEPEIETADVQPGDAFVLCSDGLWEMVSPEEMAAAAAGDLKEQAGSLAAHANERAGAGSDNISIVMARVDERAAAAPAIAADSAPTKGRAKSTVLAFLLVTVVAAGAVAAIYQPWKEGPDADAVSGKQKPVAIPGRTGPVEKGRPKSGAGKDAEKKSADPALKPDGEKRDGSAKKADPMQDLQKAKPDSSKPDTQKPDAKKPASGKPDTTKPDTGRPDSGRPDSGRTDSGKTDSGKTGPGKTDPGKTESGKQGSAKPDTGKTDTKKLADPDNGAGDTTKPKGSSGTTQDGAKPQKQLPDAKSPDAKSPDGTSPNRHSDEKKPDLGDTKTE